MNMRLVELTLQFRRSKEELRFDRLNYYYGQMGAGKSSIARLIDYCLGGDLELSPTLQTEFVSATLIISIAETILIVERPMGENQVLAHWDIDGEPYDLALPARVAAGELVPDTGVENLSDLIFYLVGIRSPRVRRSKVKEDSQLERLSMRDLLWYCYLDQDSMDSSFFNLESDANPFRRNKSKDVLRYVVGYHQERVSELEAELQSIHDQRMRAIAGAESLQQALIRTGIATDIELSARIRELQVQLEHTDSELMAVRQNLSAVRPHAVDSLAIQATQLSSEIASLQEAISAVESAVQDHQRHLNELAMLRIKFQRAASARAVLSGVEFEACPRCTQQLPQRQPYHCPVCGQEEPEAGAENLDPVVLEKDITGRVSDLRAAIQQHEVQLSRMQWRRNELIRDKERVDREMSLQLRQYDSSYLSTALTLERRKVTLEASIDSLQQYSRLSQSVEAQLEQAAALEAQEIDTRRRLKDARTSAEKDTANLRRLEKLFLDCLVRSRIPGISRDDAVTIRPPHFLPEVASPETGDLAVTSFANISSGGKKSLFKSCFALAMHRLAVEIGARLPTFLVIDSTMKNISERENREQFEGFHLLIYELAASELSQTQFILIDKEYLPPPANLSIEIQVRHMTPDNPVYPPLVTYRRGH